MSDMAPLSPSESPVLLLRWVVGIVGAFVAATVVYTVITDGSPFHMDILTPWMAATLIDFYANVFIIYLWVLYKEEGVWSKVVWLLLLVCLGSPMSCAYVVIQLLRLSPGDPPYLALLKERHARLLRTSSIGSGE